MQDPVVAEAIEWCETGKPSTKKTFCKRFGDRLEMVDGVLTYCDKDLLGRDKRLVVVPDSKKLAILQLAHGHRMSGHQGMDKTVQRIKTNYWWFGICNDVNRFIADCHTCQRVAKPSNRPNSELMPLPPVAAVNERVHVDLFGPLKPDNGMTFVLVITDAFSKTVRLAPLEQKSMLHTWNAFEREWVCIYGCPKVVVSDCGNEFRNRLWRRNLLAYGAVLQTTTSFHPQSNGQVEIVNKTIAKNLRSFCDQTTLKWTHLLPGISFMHNTSVHSSTGATPYEIMYSFPTRTPGFDPGIPELRQGGVGRNNSGSDSLSRQTSTSLSVERCVTLTRGRI